MERKGNKRMNKERNVAGQFTLRKFGKGACVLLLAHTFFRNEFKKDFWLEYYFEFIFIAWFIVGIYKEIVRNKLTMRKWSRKKIMSAQIVYRCEIYFAVFENC